MINGPTLTDRASLRSRKIEGAALALVLIGAFLRLYHFWIPPIWVDEYGTWWVVAGKNWTEVITRTLEVQGQTPFYYLVVKCFTEIAGYGAFQLRFPSVFFGIGTLALVYPLAIKIFEDRLIAICSVAIFSVSDPFIWYSQIARPYSLGLFLTLLSFWSLLSLLSRENAAMHAVYVLSTALTIYVQYLFGLIVIIQFIYLIHFIGYRRIFTKSWFLTFATMALLLLPATGPFYDLLTRRHTIDWLTSRDLSQKIANVILYLIGSAPPVAVGTTILAVMAIGFDWAQIQNLVVRKKLLLPLMWFLFPLFLFSTAPLLIGVTLVQTRYLLFAYPATYFLFVWFMLNVRANDYRKWFPMMTFIVLSVVFSTIPALRSSDTFSRWPDRSWNDALAKLVQSYRSDGLVVAQIGLVEADRFAINRSDTSLLSFLSWPLIANLSAERSRNIAILPFRLTEATQSYFRSTLDQAVKNRRVWLVGGGDVVIQFRERLIRDFDYRVASQSDHGDEFHVFLLERPAHPSD